MDITNLIQIIITLIFALISAFLVPYIKNRTDRKELDSIMEWVRIAVEAAEMIYTQSGMGEQKKAYVMEFLISRGFSVDFDSLDNLIESAVLNLNREMMAEYEVA